MTAQAETRADDPFANFGKTLAKAMTAKRNMIAKGLTRAQAKCPYCDGNWQLALAGRKNHLRLSCDGTCGTAMME